MNKTLDELFVYPKELVDEESKRVIHLVRQWADKEIISQRQEYRENYEKLFIEKRKSLNLTIGLQRLTLPEEHGGFGWNNPASTPGIVSVLTEIGRADAAIGVVSAIKCVVFAAISMAPNLDKVLCDVLAPIYCADELKTASLILPGAGNVWQETPLFLGRSIKARIEPDGEGYSVNGNDLRPINSGAVADLFCVVCADKLGRPCIALVPGNDVNVVRGKTLLETGLNASASANADVSFNNVKIPKSYVIARDGVVEEIYTWLNLLLGGVSVGAAMNFFEMISDWSETRTIKGGYMMKENPLCAAVLADVADEVFTARILLYDLAHIMSKPEDWGHSGSQRVYTISQIIGSRVQQSAIRAINRGMELMGSAGYSKEWHVEKHWRDVKTIQSYLCGVGAEAPVKMDTARFFYDCKEI
ncbi:MAG: acyl-CoA/acyl-ACP dehydrogenase [Deltaproteobacteria bacterium]|nr:acyl-CoA/acyl-ACP dehydrogenase [Deltaproteobacteria bacterium]